MENGNLILSRNAGESLFIGDTIEVKVISMRGNQCKLKITAPLDVNIIRSELKERKEGVG